MTDPKEEALRFYRDFTGMSADIAETLTPAGSPRLYYRIKAGNTSLVATFNPDLQEIRSFYYISQQLINSGIPVPEVYAISEEKKMYLQEDIGDTSVFSTLDSKGFIFDDEITRLFQRVLRDLVIMQVEMNKRMDYSRCYPVASFDISSILFDLQYFRQFFLLPHLSNVNESRLEEDFRNFAAYLAASGPGYFMYRDFQSRNILLHKDKLYYIDFQAGRRGPLQYDPASLLNQARIRMPEEKKESLLGFYLKELERSTGESAEDFMKYYPGFSLLRLLQNLGAYGFRGITEGKQLFRISIRPAMELLGQVLKNKLPLQGYPELKKCLEGLCELQWTDQ